MEHLPLYLSLLFTVTTLATVWFFYKASNYSFTVLSICIAWLLFQGIMGLSGFYTLTETTPPRFLLLTMPPLLCIILMFTTVKGRGFIDGLDLKTLTLLHIVRIPVEIVLYGLYLHQAVPELMTFEGRNLDILSGLSAPLIVYFGFITPKISKKIILIWNFVCLALLLNIVVNAILSAPFPFQQFAFDQPNIAVLYFPYNWLPCFIVPIVALSHWASIRQLLK